MIGQDALFGFVIFFAAAVIGKIISERALRQLNPEEKSRLLDAFSNYRIYSLGLVLALIILYMAAVRFYPHFATEFSYLYFICLVVALVAASVLSVRKMHELRLPASYVKRYIISMGVQYVGLGFLFAPLASTFG